MKLIIDINKKLYKLLCDENVKGHYLNIYERAILNGTPLPKGHGRLIDADAYAKKYSTTNINGRIGEEYIIAPTIIEADTESEDKE